MKVGIIGVGNVGTSCAKAMLLRGSCQEIVLFDVAKRRAKGIATDLSHGELLCPPTRIVDGHYKDFADATIIIITAGINEQSGKATDKSDKLGRLRLLPHNANVYKDIIPRVAEVAPKATILVVTDPPDALAEVAQKLTATNPVISSGTYLDTLRFRIQLARRLKCHPASVNALVLGEHGTSQVYVWSTAQVGGEPILNYVRAKKWNVKHFKAQIENAVRFANLGIIKGTGASQHGIGIVTARIVEAILRDERLVAPIGVHQKKYRTTFSLPAVIGSGGVIKVLTPSLSSYENNALTKSANFIKMAFTIWPEVLRRPS